MSEEPIQYTKLGKPRKRKPKTSNTYFTEITQDAILSYVKSTDNVERNKIYNEHIEHAFFKLTQNIIHTFKFYYSDGDSIEDMQQEVIAFLLEKLKLYKPHKGKAYSYFGTIVKRYLIIKNKKNYKKLQNTGEMDDNEDNIEIREDMVVSQEEDGKEEFIDAFIRHMDKNLYNYFPKSKDAATANAIIELFRQRESLEIFSKKTLYVCIREMVDIDTPQITKIANKMKEIYKTQLNIFYKHGDLR